MELFGGMIRVDSFRAGANAYFLTHYHSDHMTGLTRNWSHGPLFCTPETAAMIFHRHCGVIRNTVPTSGNMALR